MRQALHGALFVKGLVSIYLKLGWRNLLLHPLRTGLTVAALAIGIGALTFLSAMNDGWMQQIRTNFALTLTGHIQIHASGFEQTRKLSRHIDGPATIIQQLAQRNDVNIWAQRLRVSGLASTANANAGSLIYGIQPERESRLSRMAGFVTEGEWLRPEDRHGIVLGDVLAEHLQATLDSKVVLMAALPDGNIASEVFRVRGLMHSGIMNIDNLAAIVPLATAQRWLDMDDAVTDIVIRADNFEVVTPLAKALADELAGQGLEILRWNDIDPMAEQWAQFADAYTWIILAVVIIVVLAEVLNTMLMSTHDRIREFGLMGALGVRSGQLFTMVVWETVILVLVGSLAGFAFGAWGSYYFGVHGIDLSHFSEAFSFMYMGSVVYPALRFESCASILSAAVAGAAVAGLFPAWKASTLEPVQALREI